LNQILRNLLGNALKFTESGSVSLDLTIGRGSAGGREAVFRVADTGVGIVPEQQDAIFEAFKQEDGSISRKFGGSGLGLAISRQLAELLGGRIEVDSEKGLGSCFTLRLPLSSEESVSEQGELNGLAR
jgi:signal transduction histidine kinase